MQLEGNIQIEQRGRGGRILLRVDDQIASLDWEFGGNDVVAIIYVPTPAHWYSTDPWRRLDRSATLDALGREICRLKCRNCTFHWDDHFLELRQPACG